MSRNYTCLTCGEKTRIHGASALDLCENRACPDYNVDVSRREQATRNPLGLPSLTHIKDDEGLGSDRVLEARMRLALEALETDWTIRDKEIGDLYREMESMRNKHSDLKSRNAQRSVIIVALKTVISQLTHKAVE